MKMNPRTGIIALLILGVLGLGVFAVINRDSVPAPERGELPIENQLGLEDDRGSINTIVYGTRSTSETKIFAVNDSGKNNTLITELSPDVKFVTPLKSGKQLFYIAETNDGDIGASFEIKTINDTGDGVAGVYSASEGYGIDRYVISENNEWIAWYEVKPEEDEYTHISDFYRVYKANLGRVLSGTSGSIEPILLSEIKAAPGVALNVPSIILNNGEVFFDVMMPDPYYTLHYGFKNEQGQDVLPINTYNSAPYLFNQNNLLYTAFNPNNAKLTPKEGTRTREQVLNTNTVKVTNINSRQITTVGPGDDGEQYKHTVYVEGNASGEFKFLSSVYKISGEGQDSTLSPQEIQLVTKNSDGSFSKKSILNTSDGKSYRIMSVGDSIDGSKTVLIGEETSFEGNLGTGVGVGSSGYKNQIYNIRVINLNSKNETVINSIGGSEFEFIAIMIKTPEEKIGIDRNKELAEEFDKKSELQLQLDTFVPIEPRRERTNFRAECEKEWKERGYDNYEACAACPLYIYNDGAVGNITIIPKTLIAKQSANPQLNNNEWSFSADKNGNLKFTSGNYSKIDYLFPRGKVISPSEGIIFAPENMESKIAEYSYSLGLNTREVKDIVAHFKEELGNFEYVFFSTLSDSQAQMLVDFDVYPKPKVMKNIMFYAKKYPSVSEVKGKVINSISDRGFSRADYTVVAWGSVIE